MKQYQTFIQVSQSGMGTEEIPCIYLAFIAVSIPGLPAIYEAKKSALDLIPSTPVVLKIFKGTHCPYVLDIQIL